MIKMYEVINNAYKENPFYYAKRKDKGTIESISELPVICKNDIKENYDIITKNLYEVEDWEDILQDTTSGSTGMYLKVFWKKKDYIRSLIPVWILRKKYYNIFPSNRLLFTFSGQYRDNTHVREGTNVITNDRQLGISTDVFNKRRLFEFYSVIIDFKPEWLILQPSMGNILFECIEKYGEKPFENVRYVEYTGEYLTKEMIRKTRETLQCNVGNLYGLTEVNEVAFMCPQGKLHCIESNVYVEILDKKGCEVPIGSGGEICVTSLTNSIMPFIRYKTGDRGKLSNACNCGCGNKGNILSIDRGRTSEYVVLQTGERLSTNIFFDIVQFINEEVGNSIKQFQIVQEEINRYKVSFSINKEYITWKETIMETFVQQAAQKGLEDVNWEFSFSRDYLTALPSGKLNFFYSKI